MTNFGVRVILDDSVSERVLYIYFTVKNISVLTFSIVLHSKLTLIEMNNIFTYLGRNIVLFLKNLKEHF